MEEEHAGKTSGWDCSRALEGAIRSKRKKSLSSSKFVRRTAVVPHRVISGAQHCRPSKLPELMLPVSAVDFTTCVRPVSINTTMLNEIQVCKGENITASYFLSHLNHFSFPLDKKADKKSTASFLGSSHNITSRPHVLSPGLSLPLSLPLPPLHLPVSLHLSVSIGRPCIPPSLFVFLVYLNTGL